jgi:N-acetyl-gamma-glutamyl-phosphate/LysW-gamma-L-alpha-aminoadipyl-6-phosphate reductase
MAVTQPEALQPQATRPEPAAAPAPAPPATVTASIVGASGYTGGELLRLLGDHPHVQVAQVSSERHAGEYVYSLHPNLRKRSALRFVPAEALEPCDVLFLALPHGVAQQQIERYAALAPRIVDLSADFRLRDPALYREWYGAEHAAPDWLARFVYGLPELERAALRGARWASGVGCNAAAAILALLPLVRAQLIDAERPIIIDVKVGSSEAGAGPNGGSHHPERSRVVRTYAATGHRHSAEIVQALGLTDVHLTITAVELVRGALAAAHAFVREGVSEKELWRAYRAWAADEPFVRVVKERGGLHRVPDPKILAGTNYVDAGFELDRRSRRVVALAAIDNLMKGAAGSAVQACNLMLGLDETTGLTFGGLHPI